MNLAPRTRPPFDLLVIADASPRQQACLSSALTAPDVNGLAVLLRDKDASARELAACATELRKRTGDRGVPLLISDRVDVALLVDADGVHLPERGLAVSHARALLGPKAIIGASRHDLAGVLSAQNEDCDYATLSPVFASPNKGAPIGVQAFAAVATSCTLPLYALGGVRTQDVPALAAVGAAGVAVIRDVMDAPQPAAAVSELLLALRSHLPHRSLAPQGDAG